MKKTIRLLALGALFLVIGCESDGPFRPERPEFINYMVISLNVNDTVQVARINGTDLKICYLGFNENYARMIFTGVDGKLSNFVGFDIKYLNNIKEHYFLMDRYYLRIEILAITIPMFKFRVIERVQKQL